MTPLPDNPRVIVWIQDDQLLGVATNVSPETHLTLVRTKDAWVEYQAGLPFANSVLDGPTVPEKS